MFTKRQTNLLRAAARKFAAGKIDLYGPAEALAPFSEALVPVVRDAVAEVLPDLSKFSVRVAAEALILGTARYLSAADGHAAKKAEKTAPKKAVKAVKAVKAAPKKGGKNGK